MEGSLLGHASDQLAPGGSASWQLDDTTTSSHQQQHQHQQHHQQYLQHQHHKSSSPSSSSSFRTDDAAQQASSDRQEATNLAQQQQQLALGDLLVQCLATNAQLVRKMIAQNSIELLCVCVIITYLIYYFSLISRRPRLIGNSRSKFVQLIKRSLKKTLESRFSPLIYFWGTNPQTALFGYLQGNPSLDEMPRNKFKRQYLYVSDAQYLTSNIDLSEHYDTNKNSSLKESKMMRLAPLECLDVHQLQLRLSNSSSSSSASASSDENSSPPGSLLGRNIRLALDDLLVANNKVTKSEQQQQKDSEIKGKPRVVDNSSSAREHFKNISASSSSSSDSGVFAASSTSGHSSSCSSSSTSSLSAANDADDQQQQTEVCSCKARYNSQFHQLRPNDLPRHDEHFKEHKQQLPERLEFGQCALDWHKDSHANYHRNKLVALISAGMTTGSDKKYVTDTVQTLTNLGHEVCVFIRRGVGGLKLSSTKFFSPAKWRDFEAAVTSVRQQRPGARLVAVGFSFGSIELCRYLSMSGPSSLVDGALLISCPFDPEAGGRNMRKRLLNRRIDAYLARQLGKQLHQALAGVLGTDSASPNLDSHQKHINHHGSLVDLAKLPKIKSLVDFEDNFNRKLQNYPNSEAYAADSRLRDHLASIETPTLCLSSEDDFMAPLKLLPLDEIKANKNLCMILTKRGGHMAFIDGIFWPKRPYFAQRIIASYVEVLRQFETDKGEPPLPQLSDGLGKTNHHHRRHRHNQLPSHHHLEKSSHLLQMFHPSQDEETTTRQFQLNSTTTTTTR